MKDEIEEVLRKYSGLNYDESTNALIGTIEVFPNDTYEVKIVLTNWKSAFPEVFETAERIPNHIDRHIYPKGNFCFTTTANEEILLETQVKKLIHFTDYILIPFLKNNSYYEINDSYRFGEYSHDKGILEAYREILAIQNEEVIIRILRDYCNGVQLEIKDNCFCGSGKRLVKCSSRKHYKGYRKLRHISIQTLKEDVVILINESISRKMKLYQMLLGI